MAHEQKRFHNLKGGEVYDAVTGMKLLTVNVDDLQLSDAADVMAAVIDALEARYPVKD